MVLSSKRRLSVCIGCDKIRGHSSGVIVLVNVVVVRIVVALVGTVVMPVVVALVGFVVIRVVVVLVGFFVVRIVVFVVMRVVVVLEGIVAMVVSSSEVTGSIELEIKSVIIET